MKKKIIIGSICVVFILVLVSFTSVVNAQSTKSQKMNFAKNFLLATIKTNKETLGAIGGFITIAGGLCIAFLFLLYVGIATGNDAALNLLVKIIENSANLFVAFLHIIGNILVAVGLADEVFYGTIFLILFAYNCLDQLVGFLLKHSLLFPIFWDWWLAYRFPKKQ